MLWDKEAKESPPPIHRMFTLKEFDERVTVPFW
jgi:hypothetical protein